MKQILTIFIVLFNVLSFAQMEAVNWYLGQQAGVSFISGHPISQPSAINSWGGSACISDAAGQTLFYTDGNDVFNKNHIVMQNGSQLIGSDNGYQPAIIIPVPESNSRFYIFCVGNFHDPVGLHYSIVDMELDDGKGAVTLKNIPLNSAVWAQGRITAVRHKNQRDFWIIVRLVFDSNYAAFLVTPSGVSEVPVLSPAYYISSAQNEIGKLKVSPDGKKLVSGYSIQNMSTFKSGLFDVCDFDNETGIINLKFSIYQQLPGFDYDHSKPTGIEFSPDSKYVFIGLNTETVHGDHIYQYDIRIDDSASFIESGMPVALVNQKIEDLQLASDGRIYVRHTSEMTINLDSLDVIHYPWKRGAECMYEKNFHELNTQWAQYLPNFPQEQLYRFVWQGGPCAKTPITFRHRFIPEPDSIVWNFGDGTTSTDFNPTHIFLSGGNFEVHAHVVYPEGRIEETSREVEVLPAPEPDLGPDRLMCSAQPITLDAGGDYDRYNWNGAFTPGQRTYVVSDTGTYWVRAMNNFGCFASDTVHVGLFPPPVIDETNLILSPTTCGGSTGAIRGLTVSGTQPIALEWKNNAGNVLSNEADIYNLPIGNYYLWATDGNGCTNLVSQYTISDAGDVLIASVSHSDSYCGQNNGSITVTAVSGLSDMLEYSIDNGDNWQNEDLFEGLTPGLDYDVRVRVPDGSGCQAVYVNNPITIEDFAGPQVDPFSLPATGSNANGSITLTASGFGNLTYSLNGGTPQSSGEFTGLIAGTYTWRVEDENGCFTEGSIEVGQEAGFIISAIAGNSAVCLGNAPVAPLLIENFTGVQAFTATLEYDATLVNCEGFRPGSIHPQLEANLIAEVYPASQRIVVTWSGSAPLTLSGSVTVLDLVFSATQAGNSFLTWDQAPAATWFTGEYGSIEPEFQIGQIQVNHPPVLAQQFPVNVCEGELAWLSASATGNEPLTYQWTLPDGSTSQNSSLMFFDASTTHSGQYRVKVSDALGCSDSTLLTLQVTPNPADWFLQDTILFENQYLLSGPAGYASYLWSTGDTLPEITVNTEGLYTLQLTTHNLCAGTDSTYLKMLEAESPFLVPNAFTPNNDGLNDTFRPVVDYERVRMFSMVIYNRWGQQIFETTNPAEGWDGKDAPAGVYSWVISYSNNTGILYQLKGMVTLIK